MSIRSTSATVNAPVPADASASTTALTHAMQALADQLRNINPPSAFITSENKAFVEQMVDLASLEDEDIAAKDIDLKIGDDIVNVQLLIQALIGCCFEWIINDVPES
ncbi:hypothetical protein H107_07512 [Trichophyton rubrum CBS 202.88]|nr:hypothetical protein H107_07512 [Trichophyton rubrum CBS 202.88]KMQ42478.1 hypothetical protein HL42_6827 [Trichophyton rubrum]